MIDTDRHQCMAIAKTTGQRCQQAAVRGTANCRVHGVNTGIERKAEARNAVADTLAADASLWKGKPLSDPFGALQDLAAELVHRRDHAGRMLDRLGDEIRYKNDGGSEQLRAEVKVWQDVAKMCHTVLADMVRLGIEERAQEVSEATAALFCGLVRAIYADPELAMTPAQRAVSGRVAARHLKAVGAGDVFEAVVDVVTQGDAPTERAGASRRGWS